MSVSRARVVESRSEHTAASWRRVPMIRSVRSMTVVVSLLLTPIVPGLAGRVAALPEGQMSWAAHVTLAPRWLDPGETESAITPFMVLYAIHDAMVKPMPG